MILLFSVGVFFAWSIDVAVGDCLNRRIPNSLVIAGLAGALLFAASGKNPFGSTLSGALIGMVLGFAALFPFFALRVMGAADVKVFAVLGAWCGAHALLWLWLAATIAAFIHAVAIMYVTHTSLGSLWQRSGPTLALGSRRSSPYAAFLVIPAALWLGYLVVSGGLR